MTVHYEPHRITGANRLAAVCDVPGCATSLYVDGTEQLTRLGWDVVVGDTRSETYQPRRAHCPRRSGGRL